MAINVEMVSMLLRHHEFLFPHDVMTEWKETFKENWSDEVAALMCNNKLHKTMDDYSSIAWV